jgi:hypothetical protein
MKKFKSLHCRESVHGTSKDGHGPGFSIGVLASCAMNKKLEKYGCLLSSPAPPAQCILPSHRGPTPWFRGAAAPSPLPLDLRAPSLVPLHVCMCPMLHVPRTLWPLTKVPSAWQPIVTGPTSTSRHSSRARTVRSAPRHPAAAPS